MRDDHYSEALLVRYLLGDLPEDEQVEIEERAFQDQQYLQNIQAVESDLIDAYVRGELSGRERQQFEGRFFASAERRQKVEFARALARVLPETTVTEKRSRLAVARPQISLRDSLAAFLRGLSPVARLALAAAVLLIGIGGSWLVTETLRLRTQVMRLQTEQQSQQRQQQTLESQFADERARNENLSSQLQGEREQRERNEELIRALEREKEAAATKPAQPAVLSLALLPGIPRGGSARPKLVLPPSARLVRLQIGIEPGDEYKSFRVELHTQAAQPVWSQDHLSARTGRAGRVVVLNLPARRLGAGQYELALKGIIDEGKTEDLGYYYFDVLKK
jgi:hypothetical protein